MAAQPWQMTLGEALPRVYCQGEKEILGCKAENIFYEFGIAIFQLNYPENQMDLIL